MSLQLEKSDPGVNLPYTADPYCYVRRKTRVVRVGDIGVGGDNPIRVQSMTTTDTMDTEGTIAESIRLVEAGCEIVRITTPTAKDAENLKNIRAGLEARGVRVPLVADIHFNPNAAMEAAKWADKVRINPGNFADAKKFAVLEYTDDEYQRELERLELKFKPLLLRCTQLGRSIRIGTNHGSLSDRIMNRFGDTPEGMVESALEFTMIAERYDFHDLIFSMKASNPKVMIQAYRLLAARLDAQGLNYPFHLGVTEAGNGEDGRIKSAIGIASLLEDGIGDTIRVSLTEDPENEIPVALRIARRYTPVASHLLELGKVTEPMPGLVATEWPQPQTENLPPLPDPRDPYHFTRRETSEVQLGKVKIGGENVPQVIAALTDGRMTQAQKAAHGAGRVLTLAAGSKPKTAKLAPGEPDVYLVYEAEAKMSGGQAVAKKVAIAKTIPTLKQPLIALVENEAEAKAVLDAGADGLYFEVGNVADTQAALRLVAGQAQMAGNKPLFIHATNQQDLAHELEAVANHAFTGVETLVKAAQICASENATNLILSLSGRSAAYTLRANRLLAARLQEKELKYPIYLAVLPYSADTPSVASDDLLIDASLAIGALLTDGIGDAVSIDYMGQTRLTSEQEVQLAFNILQAAGSRSSKADFIACPSCGRTLFDLQSTTERIKLRTGHLVGVKIAVMGCIVNGLGELADADFGYMGGAPDKVNLFVGKTCVEKGVPTERATDRLVEIIKEHGRWIEPDEQD